MKITAGGVIFRRVDVLIHTVMVKKHSIQNMVLFTILSFNFYEYMSIDYISTGHIEIKGFGIKSTDTHSLVWIFSYNYLISFTHDAGALM